MESFWRIFEFRIPCAHLLSVSNGVPVGGCLFSISLEGSYDGADVSTARVNSSCLGFCGGSYDVLERSAKDADGSVDAVRFINPSEAIMDGNVAT